MHGQPVAELTLTSFDGTTAVLHAHDEDKKDTAEFYKWVSCIGKDAGGVTQQAVYEPIRWPDAGGEPADDADVTLTGLDAGLAYEAFVTVFPDVWTPRSNTVEF